MSMLILQRQEIIISWGATKPDNSEKRDPERVQRVSARGRKIGAPLSSNIEAGHNSGLSTLHLPFGILHILIRQSLRHKVELSC